jgi:hypothetical protein
MSNIILASNAFYGENANTTWTLRVVDVDAESAIADVVSGNGFQIKDVVKSVTQ